MMVIMKHNFGERERMEIWAAPSESQLYFTADNIINLFSATALYFHELLLEK